VTKFRETSNHRFTGGTPAYEVPGGYAVHHDSGSLDYKDVETSLDVNIWFSGAFTYYYADVTSPNFNQRMVDRLFGLDLTPKLIFDIIPFSWLLDWFTNISPIFDNLSDDAQSNLVLKYGYVMGTYTKVTKTTNVNFYDIVRPFPGWDDTSPRRIETTSYDTEVLKDRYVVEPFGWGKHFNSLNESQKATLVALGMSLLPG
jgi:hypothetical protein